MVIIKVAVLFWKSVLNPLRRENKRIFDRKNNPEQVDLLIQAVSVSSELRADTEIYSASKCCKINKIAEADLDTARSYDAYKKSQIMLKHRKKPIVRLDVSNG